MKFEIIKIKTFQGDQYLITGDEKYVYLIHRAPPPTPTPLELYRHLREEDGIRNCMLHLASEIKDLAFGASGDGDFVHQANLLCWKVPYESEV